MQVTELKKQLIQTHTEFTNTIVALNESDFLHSAAGNKWNAGQQLQHIVMSVSPLIWALRLPKFVLKMWFGKANRKSRSYDELVSRYKQKLADGGRAPARFSPMNIAFSQKENVQNKLLKLVEKLCSMQSKFSNEELDLFILPHPLLGKLTIREMYYFTLYHVQHHHQQCISNLDK